MSEPAEVMGIPYDGDDLSEMERAIYDGRGVHPAAALRQIAKLRGVRLVVDQWRDDYTHAAEAMVRVGAHIESGGAPTRKAGASGNAEANETTPGVSARSADDAGTTTPTPVSHVTEGSPCWCVPEVISVPAKKSATDPTDQPIQGCNCASYNNPEKVRPTVSGPVPEVVLTPPPGLGIERDTVCVDACIARVVAYLWGYGVVTLGSCCGHGRSRPDLVLGQHEDMATVRAYIAEVDDRTWGLCQWRLAENTDLVPERMVIDPGAVPCALVEWEDKRVDL